MRAACGLVLLSSLLLPFGGTAYRLTEQGNEHYESQEFEEALRAYTEAQVHSPEAPELYYDIGNVLYRQDDFAGAAEAYVRALGGAAPELSGRAAYNLGNALYRQQSYQEAAREYRRALEVDPWDQDAKRNLELALRELSKQQNQPPQGQDEQDQQDPQPQQDSQQSQEQDQDRGEDSRRQESQQSSPEQDRQQPQEGRMTAEQARRLLDTLAEQERENLRREALRRARGRGRGTEEDW